MRRLLLILLLAGWARAAGREVSIIIDTSTSMLTNDRPRYTVQASKIIADLLDDDDRLSVARMPVINGLAGLTFRENCSSPADSSLAVLQRGNRSGYKSEVDSLIVYNTVVNAFAAEFHTARSNFTTGPGPRRMLLFIADAGGLDTCEGPLTAELQELRRAGTFVAAINLGSDTGTFGTNPGIETALLARNSEELIKAVAQVYQRFLGSKRVQTGPVRGRVEVEVDPYVKEAFLVVASDAGISDLSPGSGNPGAGAIDLNFRGGGSTQGLDGQTRSYRMIKIKDPSPGKWSFNAPDLTGGYMLLQDYAVAVRLTSGAVPSGAPVRLDWEVYDERTGQRITDPRITAGLELETNIDGQTERLRAQDGVFHGNHTFAKTGKATVTGRLSSEMLERDLAAEINVVEAGLNLALDSSPRVDVQKAALLRVRAKPMVAGAAVTWPPKLTARLSDGSSMDLLPAGGGIYSGMFNPGRTGTVAIHVEGEGGTHVNPLDASIEVLGRLELGTPVPVRIGAVKSGGEGGGALDLSNATVVGDVKAEVTSDLDRRHAALEIETPEGWKALGSSPVPLEIGVGARTWRVRLRAGACPGACRPDEAHALTLKVPRADGSTVLTVPLRAEIIPDPFLVCWWREIAAALAALLGMFIIYGYIYPYRFQARTGLQISPEPDLSEGFFYALRMMRAAHIGFYRHARVFVTLDYRIAGKPGGAFARLRAEKSGMKIRPENGQSLWRQRMDGEWEAVPPEESAVRTGTMYRNDEGTVFFDVRFK